MSAATNTQNAERVFTTEYNRVRGTILVVNRTVLEQYRAFKEVDAYLTLILDANNSDCIGFQTAGVDEALRLLEEKGTPLSSSECVDVAQIMQLLAAIVHPDTPHDDLPIEYQTALHFAAYAGAVALQPPASMPPMAFSAQAQA